MRTVQRDEVPPFLRSTSFYQALEEGNGDEFDVPMYCYKADAMLKTETDVLYLIETIRFWGIEGIPKELIEYAFSNSHTHCRSLFEDAENDLEYLKILSKLQDTKKELQMNEAMAFGELSIVQYLFENGHTWRESSMDCAAAKGHLGCMKYAHKQGCPWTEGAFIQAAGNGHLECLKYAVENGCVGDFNTYVNATGHLFLQQAHVAIGLKRTAELGACAYAAYNGHLHILQYLRENHLHLWGESTCAAAAGAGHLDCLKYVHEQGCPWNDGTATYAISRGHTACLDYALAQGCPYSAHTVYFMFWSDHPDTGKWLRQLCATSGFCRVTALLLLLAETTVAIHVLDWGILVALLYGVFRVVEYVVGLMVVLINSIW